MSEESERESQHDRTVYFTYTGDWVYHYQSKCATKNDDWRHSEPESSAITSEKRPCGTCVKVEKEPWCATCGENPTSTDESPHVFVKNHTTESCPAKKPVIEYREFREQ